MGDLKARIWELEDELEKSRRSAQYWKAEHLAGNERIRGLEAQAQEWHERYVICCEYSRLEKEALRNELIEANARIRFLEDTSSREFWAASRKIAELQDRADRAEAKLRELVEAAEWRDECNNLYTEMHIDWINGRPEGPHIYSIYEIYEEAEIAYEKALAAAKER